MTEPILIAAWITVTVALDLYLIFSGRRAHRRLHERLDRIERKASAFPRLWDSR